MPRPANSMFEQVVVKLILGPRTGKTTEDQKEIVRNKYGELINKVIELLPNPCLKRGWCAALYAVIIKGILRYGEDKVLAFIEGYKGNFNGDDDPAHGLLQVCYGTHGDINQIYKRSVTAIRAHVMNKPLKSIRAAKEDVFEWNDNFEVPTTFKRKLTEKAMEASIKSATRPRDDLGNFIPGEWDENDDTLFIAEDGRKIKVERADLDEKQELALTEYILKLREDDRLSWENISWKVERWICEKTEIKSMGKGNRQWGPKKCKAAYEALKTERGEEFTERLGPLIDPKETVKDISTTREVIKQKLNQNNWVDAFYTAQTKRVLATPEWVDVEEIHID